MFDLLGNIIFFLFNKVLLESIRFNRVMFSSLCNRIYLIIDKISILGLFKMLKQECGR